jgi:hypothetical protein
LYNPEKFQPGTGGGVFHTEVLAPESGVGLGCQGTVLEVSGVSGRRLGAEILQRLV